MDCSRKRVSVDVDVYKSTGQGPRVGASRRVEALLAMGWPHLALGAAGIVNSAWGGRLR